MLDLVIVIIEVIYQLLFAPVVPKLRSEDHFWSARLFNSIQEKNLLKIQYFKQIFDKILNYNTTHFYFMVRGVGL
jgi:hypothetical protein